MGSRRRVRLVEPTRVRDEDRLTYDEIAVLRRRQREVGQESFVERREP
jgi:hypothetical protein